MLRRLPEGDVDKQIAVRREIGESTINQATKTISRHFGVQGCVELLTRRLREGWGVPSH